MKEVFRHHDHTMVALYQEILEAEGIPVMFRNLHLAMCGLATIPITEFYPNICVIDEEDYERAREVMRRVIHEAVGPEVECPACGEKNPGNFELCFSCQGDLGEGGVLGP